MARLPAMAKTQGEAAMLDHVQARKRMVTYQLARRGVTDPRVLAAMGTVFGVSAPETDLAG